jgi:nitroimidazol reductase NimA-like FMN-containing flavoprotein (pyridoxamine 5'-phosphate oxidase superfamily)
MDDAASAIEQLSASECWALLQRTALGRLAVINADGGPDIFPVNYVPHEGSLFIRTARDAKLLHIAHHPMVAFEIDGETDDAYWSVVVRGSAERVTRDDEIRESGVRALRSWSPTSKRFVIRLTAHSVTGRRFASGTGHADAPLAFEGRVEAPHPTREPPRKGSPRPEEIPHRPPIR